MHKKIFEDISPLGKMLITFLLIGMLFITKSIYLILFISVFVLYLLLLIEKNVNTYIKIIKNYLFILLFFLLLYIIISRNSLIFILTFIYKYVISILLVICFFSCMTFSKLHLAIYKILRPLEKLNINVNSISYNITIYLYYINYLFCAKDEIYKRQQFKNKKKYGIKYLILPSVICAEDKTAKLKTNLRVNHYKLVYKKENKKTLIILLIFIILFIVTIIKEVI